MAIGLIVVKSPTPTKKSDEAFDSVYELIKRAGQCWIDKLSS